MNDKFPEFTFIRNVCEEFLLPVGLIVVIGIAGYFFAAALSYIHATMWPGYLIGIAALYCGTVILRALHSD